MTRLFISAALSISTIPCIAAEKALGPIPVEAERIYDGTKDVHQGPPDTSFGPDPYVGMSAVKNT